MDASGEAIPTSERSPQNRCRRWIAVAVAIAVLSWRNVVSLGSPTWNVWVPSSSGVPQEGVEAGRPPRASVPDVSQARNRSKQDTPPANETATPVKERMVEIPLVNISGTDQQVSQIVITERKNESRGEDTAWERSLRAATDLLYRNSPVGVLEYWLSQPTPQIYIYENIDPAFSDPANISACVGRRFLGQNWTNTWENCPWYARAACTDEHKPTSPKQQMFLSYRYNYNTDVAYLDQFLRRLSAHRTTDPAKADLFVVPYPHKSHCLCHKDFKMQSARCAVPFADIQKEVLDRLEHIDGDGSHDDPPRKASRRARHLFFHGADWLQELKVFREATSKSMTLSLGPVLPCVEGAKKSCGHIALPYLVGDPPYQPHRLAEAAANHTLWDQPRAYAVGAALSAPQQLTLRGKFLKHWKEWIGESAGGKPHKIVGMGGRRQGKKSRFFMGIYQNATVCLVLPGDGCAQKRFFDALLNGCIPLVPLWPSDETAWPHSFHHPGGCSTRIAYPFAQGSFHHEPRAGFDILDLVLAFNGTCGLECMNGTLHEFLANETAIVEKRRILQEYASVVSLGLSQESDGYPDAFAALMVRLRHHLWSLEGKEPPKQARI